MPVSIKGTGGGSVTLDAGAAAAATTLTLPNTTGTVALTAGPTFTGTVTATTVTSPSATALTIQSAGTTAMTVDTSQNVGIGTTSPQSALNVVRSSSSTTIGGSTAIAQIGNSNGGSIGLTAGLELFGSGAPSAGNGNRSGGIYGIYESYNASGNAGALAFATNSAGGTSVTERMRIDSSGNLLVGTTSSYISGSSARVQIAYPKQSQWAFFIRPTDNNTGGGGPVLFQNQAGTTIGTISADASNVAYNTSSDYRLKHFVAPIAGGLATVSALKPVTYKWIVDDKVGEGFIAHELQEIIPFAVTGEKDAVNEDGSIKPQGVDYSKIVVHLVAAIQELSAKNDALEAANAAFEARLAALEAK